MTTVPSERQIAEIIELLATSSIPPLYQEQLMNNLQRLDQPGARAVTEALRDLHRAGADYGEKTAAWMAAWQGISRRIERRLDAAARQIEDDLVGELTVDRPPRR